MEFLFIGDRSHNAIAQCSGNLRCCPDGATTASRRAQILIRVYKRPTQQTGNPGKTSGEQVARVAGRSAGSTAGSGIGTLFQTYGPGRRTLTFSGMRKAMGDNDMELASNGLPEVFP